MIMNQSAVANLISGTQIPKMFSVRQVFPRPVIQSDEIDSNIRLILSSSKFSEQINAGMKIAITVGSRGIANESRIVKSIVDFVKSKGAIPFLVPAMGSHGGATADGQKRILAEYGITEDYCKCPILSSMEVKKIGTNSDGTDVFIDKNAADADGIIINCRIKPHTAFRGPYESGIMKMMAIGLGKQYGASLCHADGFKHMARNIPLFGKVILQNSPVLFAVATLENAFDETYRIVAVNHDEIEEQEPLLLQDAYKHMACIWVKECDVLVVDHVGKNFSGDGMDPNITGTFSTPYASGGIKSQRIAVLDLSDETNGNGMGIGFANATTQRLYNKLNLQAMYANAITCTVLDGVRIPMIMNSDKECIQLCIQTCNGINRIKPRIVRIQNSLHLDTIMLSEVYLNEIKNSSHFEIISDPQYLKFDDNMNLW